MRTVKETEKLSVENQLNLGVKDLINSMNSASDLDVIIVEEDPKGNAFEILLEYPPYEDSPQKFQRYVSNLEVEEFINNVLNNIEDKIGCKYKRGGSFIKARVPSDQKQTYTQNVGMFSDARGHLYFFKKVQVRILFVEDR